MATIEISKAPMEDVAPVPSTEVERKKPKRVYTEKQKEACRRNAAIGRAKKIEKLKAQKELVKQQKEEFEKQKVEPQIEEEEDTDNDAKVNEFQEYLSRQLNNMKLAESQPIDIPAPKKKKEKKVETPSSSEEEESEEEEKKPPRRKKEGVKGGDNHLPLQLDEEKMQTIIDKVLAAKEKSQKGRGSSAHEAASDVAAAARMRW